MIVPASLVALILIFIGWMMWKVAKKASLPGRASPPLEITFGPCCFCGQDIEPVYPDPCSVKVATATDRWQMWWCHAVCFKERLAELPEAPGLLEPDSF